MRVFVLGGSGFIGAAVVRELLDHGHEVLALARSAASAAALRQAGCGVVRGDIRAPADWLDAMGAPQAVVHTAATFDEDMAVVDRRLVAKLLKHFGAQAARPRFLYTGGCWLYGESDGITETSAFDPLPDFAWMVEQRERLLESDAVEAIILHPAMVYDLGPDSGGGVFSRFIRAAQAGRPVPVVGNEGVRWPLVQRDDLALLYRLALEQGRAGADYHGVAEPAVAVGRIARVLARRFGRAQEIEIRSVEETVAELGSWARGYALDQRMIGTRAQAELGWRPTHVDVLKDLSKDLA